MLKTKDKVNVDAQEGEVHKGTTPFWRNPVPRKRIALHNATDDKTEKPKEYRQVLPQLLSDGDVVIVSNFDMRLTR